MKSRTTTLLRSATPFVSLAGTLCLMMPAYANGQGGHGMRQMRLDNPGLNNRQIRQLMNVGVDREKGALRAPLHQHPIQHPTQFHPHIGSATGTAGGSPAYVHHVHLNGINERFNRFNGQSAFLNDNGNARAVANGLELDLTSTDRSIILGDRIFSKDASYTIKVGDEERTLTSGSKVSAAEYVALQQVLNGGSQTLTVDGSGRGVNGQFNLNSISDGGKTIRAAELVIPEHVTASGDFARHADGVRVTNDLVNYGSINAFSSDKNVDTARIGARDINNNAGATISTSGEDLNLSLRADRDVNNAGSISASGNLELSAGRSINNQGSISSNRNITLNGNADSDLLVNNTGGTISALNGSINIRSNDNTGTGNTTVYGGDLLSQELNLFAGQGTTDVTVNRLTGIVNSSGTGVHVNSNTETLTIGSQCLTGDPTYYNTGDITIGGSLLVGEALAIIAGGSINTSQTTLSITAREIKGHGFNITMIAGANVAAGSGELPPPNGPATLTGASPNTTKDVSFTGGTNSGGNIDLQTASTSLIIDSASTIGNQNGGNIVLAAYAGTKGGNGQVLLPANSIINASGVGTGNNGAITVVAGGQNTTSIKLGSLINDVGGGTGGDINISASQPQFSTGTLITFDTGGNISTGNQIVGSATLASGGSIVLEGPVNTSSNLVKVTADGDLSVNNFIDANGNVSGTIDGGTIELTAQNGQLNVQANLNVNGLTGGKAGTINLLSQSASQLIVNGNITANPPGIKASGDGGTINITNTGTGGIDLTGLYSVDSNQGKSGSINIISVGGSLNIDGLITASTSKAGTAGNINIAATDITGIGSGIQILANGNAAAEGSIKITTTSGGINTIGNPFQVSAGGTLELNLAQNQIASASKADGGTISLGANTIITHSTESNPLQLFAHSIQSGNGGIISFNDSSLTPTFIGSPTKSTKGTANFLELVATGGILGGNGGIAFVRVGGNLTVDPTKLQVQPTDISSDNDGGSITLEAGQASSKSGNLVINGTLNVEGTSKKSFSGKISLTSNSKTAFVIGSAKTPKNGITGELQAKNSQIDVANDAGGITLSTSTGINAFTVNLSARGKGNIITSKNVTLSAPTVNLFADEGDIDVSLTNTLTLVVNTKGSATVLNTGVGAPLAVMATANQGIELHTNGDLQVDDADSTSGDIAFFTSKGALTIAGTATISAVDGSITIENDDLNTGSITINNGATLQTSGKKGGDVAIVIGTVPKKPANAAPQVFVPGGFFTINNTGKKGQTYFGVNPNDIVALGSVNLNAVDKKLILNNASTLPAANKITFGGNNTVTADPPITTSSAHSFLKGVNLDLTSDLQSITLGGSLFTDNDSYSITEGGTTRVLSLGSQVSAAEYVALQQVIAGGAQALVLDENGRGVGGQFNVNSISDSGRTIRALQLVVPEHVTVDGDFSRHADGIRVTNDIINYGSLNAYSRNPNRDTARIAARDIDNNAGAAINSEIDLSLRAQRDINNDGSISSSGNLELSAGRSINNHGSISSDQNITLLGDADADLNVNNTGGTISALNGAINVRSSDYKGSGNTFVTGGDFLSRELNLFTGQGTTDVFVNQLTGVLNSSGTAVHVSASTATLVIGAQCLVGDPTYYNTADIILDGDILVGEDLAIISSGDVIRGGKCNSITARNLIGAGCDIYIIAGVNVTGGTQTGTFLSAQPPITQNSLTDVSFTGASATGGDINLGGTPFTLDTSATTGNGGNITLAAYTNGAAKGSIFVAAGSLINTSGSGSGNNGAVTIVAGGLGNSIQLQAGSQILRQGTGTSGDITIVTAQPTFDTGATITFDSTGKITTGNLIVPGATIVPAAISLSAINSSAGNVLIHAGFGVATFASILNDGATATANGGDVTIISDAGPISIGGLIRSNGGANASGGNVSIIGTSDVSSVDVSGVIAFAGGAAGTKGGTITITNNGTGGVNLNGFANANGFGGDGGQVFITTKGTFTTNAASSNVDSLGKGGSISITAAKIDVTGPAVPPGLFLSALGGSDSSITINTTAGGIQAINGLGVSIQTGGTLTLALQNNTINADSSIGDGGFIDIDAGTVTNKNGTITTPLILSANGGASGSGGKISYTDNSSVPTFIGQPVKAPKKGPANFLSLIAHGGPTDGNGGTVSVDVGGNLTVNPNALDVGVSPSGTAHNGGNIKLSSGNAPSTKIGSLVILDDINVDGANGGVGGVIELDSSLTKTFVLGSIKVPKNGIAGSLSAANSTISVKSGAGIQLLASDATNSNTIILEAQGKGKISQKGKGLTLSAADFNFKSDTGSIDLDTTSTQVFNDLKIFTNSSATINNVHALSDPLNLLRFGLGGITANKGLEINTTGRFFTNSNTVSVGTGGDLILRADIDVGLNSGAQLLATNGDIIIQVKDLNKGSIGFANGNQVITSGKKGGDVIVVIGDIPKKPTNTKAPNADFTVTLVGKGQAFFGVAPQGLMTQGSPVNVNGINKRVIFNNGSNDPVANVIFFAGNDTFTADPPVKVNTSSNAQSQFRDLLYSHANSESGSNRVLSVGNQASAEPFVTSTISNSNNYNNSNPTDSVSNFQSFPTLPTDLIRTAGSGDEQEVELESFSAIKPISITSLYDSFNSTKQILDGTVEAFVWSDDNLGLNEAMTIARDSFDGDSAQADSAALRKGAVLFTPSKDTTLSTPFGTVEIAKGAVAFIHIDENKLAVYDLHDSRKGSVSIANGSSRTSLSPGHCAVLTRMVKHEFEQLNPLTRVGYRSISAQHINGTKVFKGEFSTVSAMNSIRPLQAVLTSKHQNAKRMSERLMKTTAVLMQLGANREEFRTYVNPEVTAMVR